MDLKTVAILFIAALYCGCGNGDYRTMKSILPINVTLQEGDVIFRKGTGMEYIHMLALSSEKEML